MNILDRVDVARSLLKLFTKYNLKPIDEETFNFLSLCDDRNCINMDFSAYDHVVIRFYNEFDKDRLVNVAGKIWGQEYFVEQTIWPIQMHTADGRQCKTVVYPSVSVACAVYPDYEQFILRLSNTAKLECYGKDRVSEMFNLEQCVNPVSIGVLQ